jgi:transposase
MSEPWLLSEAQMRRIEPYLPLSHGIPRADDQRTVSGIIYVIRGGLMWRDAPKAYDADWFRHALTAQGTAACIPSKRNRKVAIPHDAALYRQRHKVEIMFGRLKDWRCIHTRYDRCAQVLCLKTAGARHR